MESANPRSACSPVKSFEFSNKNGTLLQNWVIRWILELTEWGNFRKISFSFCSTSKAWMFWFLEPGVGADQPRMPNQPKPVFFEKAFSSWILQYLFILAFIMKIAVNIFTLALVYFNFWIISSSMICHQITLLYYTVLFQLRNLHSSETFWEICFAYRSISVQNLHLKKV